MQKTVIETITYYADEGDIQTAAFIVLVFYNMLCALNNANNNNPSEKKEEKKEEIKPVLLSTSVILFRFTNLGTLIANSSS